MEKRKIAVVYKSKYGATGQYAEWIAKALNAELLERHAVKPEQLQAYDLVIYGGGLYASGIIGVDLVIKYPCRNLIIFTVGLADPATTDYSDILAKNRVGQTKVFHFRGDMNYQTLGLIDRGLMAMKRKMTLTQQPSSEYSDEDRLFLDTYGGAMDFKAEETIRPLLDYVRQLEL